MTRFVVPIAHRMREALPWSSREGLPSPRVPIWLQLSIATIVVLTVSISIFSYVLMERQREHLFDHTVKPGIVSLKYVADNAKVPFLTEDILALNTLVTNAASVEGHLYAFIVNNGGVIKAHTDLEQIEQRFRPFENVGKEYRKGDVHYFNYTLGDRHVLNLSAPILFQGKKLGDVHVGLSTDFIRNLFVSERAVIALVTLFFICAGTVGAVLYSLRFSRPLSSLVEATSQIARGNYDFKVNLNSRDELGMLGDAFNRMGTELHHQSIVRESFGKYVGPEVLEMIMQNPAHSWLKGKKSEASILFADIRGFTGYSEGKEPEEVVEKLNEFFAVATDVVLDHGGYIDKFIGDSVLAVFGIPVSRDDHLRICIEAAVEMQRRLGEASRNGNFFLHSVGIGIASGVVVAGNIGSQVKMEYTVIGDSVNIAAYVKNIARPGEILVCCRAEQELSDIVEVEPLQPLKIKEREGLVRLFKVVARK